MKNNDSKRHHYIPKFLIKEFTNENNMLFVYDKNKDQISKLPRSPKSIFFENHRNTIKVNDRKSSSILEDQLFQKIDDDSSNFIQRLQKEDINEDFFYTDNLAQLQFFIINLFWRIPKSDYAAKDLIQREGLKIEGIPSEDNKNSEGWNKILRFRLYKETIDQMKNSPTKPTRYYPKMIEFKKDLFVLGDCPFVFKNTLRKFTDLVEDDFFIALTSNRILSSSRAPLPAFEINSCLSYNAAIIEESKNYVVASNFKLLEASIEFYRRLKNEHLNYFVKNRLFSEL